jgi:outer membrane protein assembly factor BamB
VFSASAEEAAAFDVETGRTLWRTALQGDPGLQRVSLAFAEDTLLVGFARAGRRPAICALDASNGKIRWTFDLEGNGSVRGPVVSGGLLYFAGGAPAAHAVDLRTGKLVWQSALSERPTGDPIVAYGRLFVPAGQIIYAFGP